MREWKTISGQCSGDIPFRELPPEVQRRVKEFRAEGALPHDRQWQDIVFVDEPLGQMWRVEISRFDGTGELCIAVDKVVYREMRSP